MMKDLELVLKKLDIPYTDDMMQKLESYMDSILEKKEHINLTAITERDEFVKRHYIDSLLC